jgi:hypothetical protein
VVNKVATIERNAQPGKAVLFQVTEETEFHILGFLGFSCRIVVSTAFRVGDVFDQVVSRYPRPVQIGTGALEKCVEVERLSNELDLSPGQGDWDSEKDVRAATEGDRIVARRHGKAGRLQLYRATDAGCPLGSL